MPQVLEIETPGDHIVLLSEGRRLLLDTGSPVSVGRGIVSIAGERYVLRPETEQIRLDQISEKVGVHIDALIGTDLLQRLPLTIDCQRRTVTLLTDATAVEGDEVRFTHDLPVPVVACDVGGRRVHAVVDTGAALGYLAADLWTLPEPEARRRDFHMTEAGLVDFETPVWTLRTRCGPEFDSCFGRLPDSMAGPLRRLGIQAVLGADLWKQYRVTFDLAGRRLVVAAA